MAIYINVNDGELIKDPTPFIKWGGGLIYPYSAWTRLGDAKYRVWPSIPEYIDGQFAIYDERTLNLFRNRVNAGEVSLDAIVVANFTVRNQFTPIADYTYTEEENEMYYNGTFNGNGCTISNLMISSTNEYQGLFGYIEIEGIVKDLTLNNPSIEGADYIGGIAAFSRGTITNCHIIGDSTITSSNSEARAGGICGYNFVEGTISDCTNEINISSGYLAGGIAGQTSGEIKDCSNTGTITALYIGNTNYAGGIVGYSNETTVLNCINTGYISGGTFSGGIVGDNYTSGIVTECENNSDVSGRYYAGGVVGQNFGIVNTSNANEGTIIASASNGGAGGIIGYNNGTVCDCNNTDEVSGGFRAGGIVAYNTGGEVFENVNSGSVTTTATTGYTRAGGIVGENDSRVTGNTNSGDVSGTYFAGGIVGYNEDGGTVSNNTNTGNVTGLITNSEA